MKRAVDPKPLRPLDPADLRIDRSARPGWPTGAEVPPAAGQYVYCQHGMAEVAKVLGRTGNGSRLLVLRLLDQTAAPFHASAANVLVSPGTGPAQAGEQLPSRPDWLR